MGHYYSGMTTTIAGSSVLPVFAILSTATVAPTLREVAVYNTTSTACTYRLVTFTGGTAGSTNATRAAAGVPPALCLAKAGWTASATIVADVGPRLRIGAADASAVILGFGGDGIWGDTGATAGIGLIPVGTGQIIEVYFGWDE
jgi:hypothetical protein